MLLDEKSRSPDNQPILAVFFDFGDTLADEASEVKDETGTTLRAELIPTAAETVRAVRERGHALALVADGRPGTYDNVLRQHGLHQYFEAFAVSELIGVEKPHARMFLQALNQLGIHPSNYGQVVMVGNRLERDVRGANQLGLVSVWINWSPRYAKRATDELELPDFEISRPIELLEILDQLQAGGMLPAR